MSQFRPNISSDEITLLPKALFGGKVEVVDSEQQLDEACDWLLRQPIIGFDTETRPAFKAGMSNKVALLQLSGGDRCFLFRLCRMKFDRAIMRILESRDIVKVGAAVRDDIRGLQSLRHFRPQNFVDLQSIVGEWGIEEKSVRKVAAVVLGVRISKAQRLSNWEAATLTSAQVDYAATDAWVCLEIYNKLLASSK